MEIKEPKYIRFDIEKKSIRKLCIAIKFVILCFVSLPDFIYFPLMFFLINGMPSNLRYFHAENKGLKEVSLSNTMAKSGNRLFMGIDFGVAIFYVSFLLQKIPPFKSIAFAVLVLSLIVGIVRYIIVGKDEEVFLNETIWTYKTFGRFFTERKREALALIINLFENFRNDKNEIEKKYDVSNAEVTSGSLKDNIKLAKELSDQEQIELDELREKMNIRLEQLKEEYSDVFNR